MGKKHKSKLDKKKALAKQPRRKERKPVCVLYAVCVCVSVCV
jgi:hypothetical protein